MEAKDLMIGDYVYNHRNWECPIVEIHKNSAIVIARYYGEEEFLLSDLRPIPLTQEILEKNGWEKCNIDVVDDDEQYGCAYGSFYVTWWRKVKLLSFYFEDKNAGLHYEMISELPTKYIHQLQHALKLCGIDKEIVL